MLHVFPSFGAGGPEVRTAGIINQTLERFRHSIISLDGGVSGQERLSSAADVPCLAAGARSISGLAKLIKSHRPALVLTYGWGGTDAILAAHLAGCHRVVHAEDGFLDDEVATQKSKRRIVRRFVFQAARALVVPSLTLREIARRSWRIRESKLRYIPNGIDTVRFSPPSAEQRWKIRQELGLPQEALVIGIVGALRPEKNQLRLLEAFSAFAGRFPQSHVAVIGDGPLKEAMLATAERLSLKHRIRMLGNLPDPASAYQAMDILALSSDTEQMPLSVLEGMATGLPVVSTDVGDVKAMVCAANQPFVPSLSEPSLYTDACTQLMSDPEARASLGAANRERCVSLYDRRVMLREYTALYESHLPATAARNAQPISMAAETGAVHS